MVWNWIAWFFNYCDRSRERELYADLHKVLYENGFIYQLSFYGTLVEPYDGKHVQTRIEIVSRAMFEASSVTALYNKFSCYKPDREYSLFAVESGDVIEVKVK